MDPNLISIVLFVALCWMSFGTNAQNDTTAAANTTISSISITAPANTSSNATGVMMTNATVVASNVTSPVPTVNTSSNATGVMTTNATAVASNVTTPVPTVNTSSNATGVMTTNATGVMTTNATAVASNVTTTVPTANTSSNATGVMTTNATGVASNVTTTAPTTTAPPLVENTTVVNLLTNVSSAGCGSTQVCAAEPSSCDPSKSDSCFFLGARPTSGHNFEFSLSGASEGYLAATLFSQSAGNDTVYICAKNNGVVKFIPALYSNGQFFNKSLPVNNVKGKINGNKIQCTFAVTVPNATVRSGDTSFDLGVETGSYDTTTGKLGSPTLKIRTGVLDLSNPDQTVTNLVNAISTTSAPTTTAGTITLQQSVSKALLIVLGFLSLAML